MPVSFGSFESVLESEEGALGATGITTGFVIKKNYTQPAVHPHKPCRHAEYTGRSETRGREKLVEWRMPWTLHDPGPNPQGVCLLCVIEMAKRLDIKEVR